MELNTWTLPEVSIVMPAYNAGGFLSEAINSVLRQTYPHWELLIIDDGSTDQTASIVRNYVANDERIKFFALGVNSATPAVPRNVGMRQAKGDYIAFLDSDDLWLPEKLYKQVQFMEQNKDVFLCYARYYIENDNKILDTIQPKEKCMQRGHVFEQLFLSQNFIPCLTVMLRNPNRVAKYYFDENKKFRAIEDFDLWLKVAQDERIDFINIPLGIYRVHGRNASMGIKNFIVRSLRINLKWKNSVSAYLMAKKYILFLFFLIYLFIAKIVFLLVSHGEIDLPQKKWTQ